MIDRLGISCTRTPVTKTVSNTYADETLTDGTTATIVLYIKPKQTNDYSYDVEGETIKNDILALSKNNVTINKNDKINDGANTFRVMSVEPVSVEGYIIYKKINLFQL